MYVISSCDGKTRKSILPQNAWQIIKAGLVFYSAVAIHIDI